MPAVRRRRGPSPTVNGRDHARRITPPSHADLLRMVGRPRRGRRPLRLVGFVGVLYAMMLRPMTDELGWTPNDVGRFGWAITVALTGPWSVP